MHHLNLTKKYKKQQQKKKTTLENYKWWQKPLYRLQGIHSCWQQTTRSARTKKKTKQNKTHVVIVVMRDWTLCTCDWCSRSNCVSNPCLRKETCLVSWLFKRHIGLHVRIQNSMLRIFFCILCLAKISQYTSVDLALAVRAAMPLLTHFKYLLCFSGQRGSNHLFWPMARISSK